MFLPFFGTFIFLLLCIFGTFILGTCIFGTSVQLFIRIPPCFKNVERKGNSYIQVAGSKSRVKNVETRGILTLGGIIAPQAQLFETAKDRSVSTEAPFKQVVTGSKSDHVLSLDAQ